jgi:hypothetical protein
VRTICKSSFRDALNVEPPLVPAPRTTYGTIAHIAHGLVMARGGGTVSVYLGANALADLRDDIARSAVITSRSPALAGAGLYQGQFLGCRVYGPVGDDDCVELHVCQFRDRDSGACSLGHPGCTCMDEVSK